MYEIENYIHPSLISQLFGIEEEFIKIEEGWLETWKKMDVSKNLSSFLKQLKADKYKHITGEGVDSIKKTLNERGAPLMTIELLDELGAHAEVKEWFEKISAHLTVHGPKLKAA
jgi:hypothetical protein